MAEIMDGMHADRKQISQRILVSIIGYDKVNFWFMKKETTNGCITTIINEICERKICKEALR